MTVTGSAKGFLITSGFRSNGFPVCATGTLDLATNNPSASDTVTINARVYTFEAAVAAPDDVLIGTDAVESIENLIAAINRGNGEGTLYGTGTTVNADVSAVVGASTDEMDVTAKVAGVVGNSITTATDIAGASWTQGATLTGGLDGGVWRVPLLLGADQGLELKSESITFDAQLINSDGAIGSRSRGSGDIGNIFHSGDMTFDMKYRGFEALMGVAFGLLADPVQQSGEDAYLHVFQPANSLEGLMGTLVLDKIVSVWEYPSVKINSMTITSAAGGIMEITFNIFASNLNRNKAAGVNNQTTVQTITVPVERQFVLFDHLAVWMNGNGDADFADADLVYPTSFSLTIANQMNGTIVTTRYGREIDEPVADGFFEVTGTIEFPKYEEEKFVDAAENKTLQKLKAEWVGPIVPGATTVPARLTAYFPELQIATASPNSGGPGLIPLSADFTAARNAAGVDPTGFPTGYGSNALNLELVNGFDTNAIASQ